ncbi:MAG: hypothetical protein PHC88_12380 [Terrimicrobiaceae bacterium]|nr:hypothetical protein [Terrimicrobiaceae bacterium]
MAAEAFLNDVAEMSLFLSKPNEPEEVTPMRDAILKLEKQRGGIRKKYRESYKASFQAGVAGDRILVGRS